MKTPPETIRRAIDLARNHHLIEQEEICVDEDGRMMFERRLREFAADGGNLEALLAVLPEFTTTSWKIFHPSAQGGRISWPWDIQPDQGAV